MQIVMITTNDPAGVGISFTNAINRFTEHRCRLVTTEIRYNFMFEKDLHVPWLRSFDELRDVLASADVVHFHMGADEHMTLGPLRVLDCLRGQALVHHHHGEPAFRLDPRRFAQRELGAGRRALVSTPDLLRGYPEAEWVPNPVPLDDPAYCPAEPDTRDTVIVSHSPTRRELKDTATFETVMAELQAKHAHIEARIIEMTEHRECLELKRTSDICFDHMQGYFGVSSLEALSQGVVTVAGLDEWNVGHIQEFAGTQDIPWVVARDAQQLRQTLERFALDRDLRKANGQASRAWMLRHWSADKIARRLGNFYERAARARD